MLKESYPYVLIGTHGGACGTRFLKLKKLSQFVLDECDKCLDMLGHAERRATNLHRNAQKEAGDDVHRNDELGDLRSLQEDQS